MDEGAQEVTGLGGFAEDVPGSADVRQGHLTVPWDLPPGSLRHMEQYFPRALWPRPRVGYVRWTREFLWGAGGRTLHYRIVDIPSGKLEG